MNFAKLFTLITMLMFPYVFNTGCTAKNSSKAGTVQPISSIDQFNSIIENGTGKLIAFHIYANWCMPCRILEPLLAEIANENPEKVMIYKVDTDVFPQIAEAFGVTGIPFVVFIKNRKPISALMGVQPKDAYVRIIKTYSDSSKTREKKKAKEIKI